LLLVIFLSSQALIQYTESANTITLPWNLNIINRNTAILVGDTVVWQWNDGFGHTVTSNTNIFSSELITGVGRTFNFTFNSVGRYDYHCQPHPTIMTGTIFVGNMVNLPWNLNIIGRNTPINQGDTVVWTLNDTISHTVSSTNPTPLFDSGTLTGLGTTFRFSFADVGTYPYRCNFHPTIMTGTITVMSLTTTTSASNTAAPIKYSISRTRSRHPFEPSPSSKRSPCLKQPHAKICRSYPQCKWNRTERLCKRKV